MIYQTVDANGWAVQVDPIKPTLKAPGTKLLKLKYGKQLSDFVFKFKLRCYTMGWRTTCTSGSW